MTFENVITVIIPVVPGYEDEQWNVAVKAADFVCESLVGTPAENVEVEVAKW